MEVLSESQAGTQTGGEEGWVVSTAMGSSDDGRLHTLRTDFVGGDAVRPRLWQVGGLMHTLPAPTDPDEYATWINQRVGAEVRRRREALDISAYALAKDAKVSDQTILNIEQGTHVPLLSTLARICVRFGIKVKELMEAAEAE